MLQGDEALRAVSRNCIGVVTAKDVKIRAINAVAIRSVTG